MIFSNSKTKGQPTHKNMKSQEFKVNRMMSPPTLKVRMQNCTEERLVLPRKKMQETCPNYEKPVQSMQISRHLIEQQESKQMNIQFNKKMKISKGHIRTRSNQVCYQEDLSNFSNSLKNISQEIIQIPFLKSIITPNTKENVHKEEINGKNIQFMKRSGSIQKKYGKIKRNGSVEVPGKMKKEPILRQSLLTFSKKQNKGKAILSILPKTKKNTQPCLQKIKLGDFWVRAIKITNSGSIIYQAIHKQTGSIYAIKSLRKTAVRNKIEDILLELKIGILFGHPNFAKCYGFFSDNDNVYLIKQYLQQGCISEQRKNLTENQISLFLNQVLFAACCLTDQIDMHKWSIDYSKISTTQGIAKLTSVNWHLKNQQYSEQIKQMIEWMFEQEDRRSTFQGTLSTNHSKIGLLSSFSKPSTLFLEQSKHFDNAPRSSIFKIVKVQSNYAGVKIKQEGILIYLVLSFKLFFIILTNLSKSQFTYILILVRTIHKVLNMKQKGKQASKKKKVEVESEEAQDVQLQQTNFNEIEKLQEYGINAADIAKLKANGFCTISSLIMAPKKELTNVKGINEGKIEKILDVVRKIENHSFMTGNQFAIKRKNVVKITTGSPLLDELLGGGIETMSITQAFGEFRTGKTQLAHTLCVTTQLPRQQGGGNGKVIYIDTEGTFRPERIVKIAERYQLDPEETLENIKYARGYTVEHLISLLNFAAAMMMESPHSLLIIDSIMAVFRNDFTGRGQLSQRQQVLGKVLSKLTKLSEQFNVAIYMTNQVMADPGNTMAHVDPKKPIGGHVLAHASTTRLYFRKGKGEQRICKIFDSPSLAENQTTFEISQGGIIDAKD